MLLILLFNIIRAVFTCRKRTSEIDWDFTNPCGDLDPSAVRGLVWPETSIFERQGETCVLNGGDSMDLLVLQDCPISSQSLQPPFKLDVKIKVPCHEDFSLDNSEFFVVISVMTQFKVKFQDQKLLVFDETWQEKGKIYGSMLGDAYGDDNFHLITFDLQQTSTWILYNGEEVYRGDAVDDTGTLDLGSSGEVDIFVSAFLQDNSCSQACEEAYDCSGRGILQQQQDNNNLGCVCTCTTDETGGWSEPDCETPVYLPVQTYATCDGDIIDVAETHDFSICATNCMSEDCHYFTYDIDPETGSGRCVLYGSCVLRKSDLTVYRKYSSTDDDAINSLTPVLWMATSTVINDDLHLYVQIPFNYDMEQINFDGASSPCGALSPNLVSCQNYWETFEMGQFKIYHFAISWVDAISGSKNYLGLVQSSNTFYTSITFDVSEIDYILNQIFRRPAESYKHVFHIAVGTFVPLDFSYDSVVRGVGTCENVKCGECQECDDLQKTCVPDFRQNGNRCTTYDGTHNAACLNGECVGEFPCVGCSPCEKCVIQSYGNNFEGSQGFCIPNDDADDTPCDDGIFFTRRDRCDKGRCIGTSFMSIHNSTCVCDTNPEDVCTAGLSISCNCAQSDCSDQAYCPQGYCNQLLLNSPVCDGGYCDQSDAVNPSCRGGHCIQMRAIVPTCEGGFCQQFMSFRPHCSRDCNQQHAIEPVCISHCDQTSANHPKCDFLCKGNCDFLDCGCHLCADGACLDTQPYAVGEKCKYLDGYGLCGIDGMCREARSCADINPCKLIGRCVDNSGTTECICPEGVSGDFCHIQQVCGRSFDAYNVANGVIYAPIPFASGSQAVIVCNAGFAPSTISSLHCNGTEIVGEVHDCVQSNHTLRDYTSPLLEGGDSCTNCPSGGCNQQRCLKPLCLGGHCNQAYTRNPQCDGGYCYQTGALEPTCEGGMCGQNFTVSPTCSNGCTHLGALNPTCHGNCTGRCEDLDVEILPCQKCVNGEIVVDESLIGMSCGPNIMLEMNRKCTESGQCVGDESPCVNHSPCGPCERCTYDSYSLVIDCIPDDSMGGCSGCEICDGGSCEWSNDLYYTRCDDGNLATKADQCEGEGLCKGKTCGQTCENGFCEQVPEMQKPCCDGGECNQEGALFPMCDGGGCNQMNTRRATCLEGGCDQQYAHEPSCGGGNCNQTGATEPSCDGGGCTGNCDMMKCEDCHKCEKGVCIEDAATDGEVCFDEMLIGGVGNCVSGACNGTSVGCLGIKCDECQMCHLGMCVPQPDGDVSCSSMFYPNPTCRQGKCIQDNIIPSEISELDISYGWQETVDILAKLNRVHVEGSFTLDLHWKLTRVNVSSPFAMVGDLVLVSTELGECGQQACIFEFYFTFLTHILCSEHIYEIEFYFMNDFNLLNVLDTTATYFIRVEPAEECALVPEGYPPSLKFDWFDDDTMTAKRSTSTYSYGEVVHFQITASSFDGSDADISSLEVTYARMTSGDLVRTVIGPDRDDPFRAQIAFELNYDGALLQGQFKVEQVFPQENHLHILFRVKINYFTGASRRSLSIYGNTNNVAYDTTDSILVKPMACAHETTAHLTQQGQYLEVECDEGFTGTKMIYCGPTGWDDSLAETGFCKITEVETTTVVAEEAVVMEICLFRLIS